VVSPQPVARFELVTHDERPVSDADFRGRFLLVYFGFTHCRVVCPRTLTTLSRALDLLGSEAEAITALYVSTDPERDTPSVMREYLAAGHPRFTGLTGTPEQVESAKGAFRVFAERRDDPLEPDGYSVPHTGIAYLMAPDGSYVTHFMDGTGAERIAAHIAAEMAGASHPA
jgi:protein SCO1/2